MTGPDFIVIGAMKCGTSTLAAQLGAQDGLFMTDPKEPNYFSDDAIFAKGPDWYGSLFDAAAASDLKGEASTHYTKRPELPETVRRMRVALPEARLVYMIRDPMVRLVSHYIHAWSEGWVLAPLDQVIETYTPLVDYGRYGWQIAPFVEAYGREAICLTSLERLRGDPGRELARIAAHIGHDGAISWIEDKARDNVSSERMRRFPLHGLLIDNPVAATLRRVLVPKAIRTRVRQSRQLKDRPAIPETRVDDLRARFLADRADLADIFLGDPSLDLSYPWRP